MRRPKEYIEVEGLVCKYTFFCGSLRFFFPRLDLLGNHTVFVGYGVRSFCQIVADHKIYLKLI